MTRTYDPYTLRMLQVDGAHQFASGYTGMGNNFVNGIDPDGQFLIPALTGFFKGLFTSNSNFETKKNGEMASTRIGNAFRSSYRHTKNWAAINAGLFVTDRNEESEGKRAWQLLSRFTWELPQTIVGYIASQGTNLFSRTNEVSYFAGATVSRTKGDYGAFTIGSFIVGDQSIQSDPNNELFQHEYGHYLQSQRNGYTYLFKFGLPSLSSATFTSAAEHDNFWTEQDANLRASDFWATRGITYNTVSNPINPNSRIRNSKWYEYLYPSFPWDFFLRR